MKWTEVLALWFILAVLASPFIGHWLHKHKLNRDFNRELHLLLDREALIAAMRKDIANSPQGKLEPDYAYRARMKERATALGFTDEDEPFHLDEPSQPRPAA